MKVAKTELPGVVMIIPDIHGDERGSFVEVWHEERYREIGLDRRYVQDNLSTSRLGTLRGLHVQEPDAQAKLVTVLEGEVFDVAVDVRRGSPTFGRWIGVTLSGSDKRQLYIPEGFAHGFQVVSASAVLHYKATAPYRAASEVTIAWDCPELGIAWPVRNPVLSFKDAKGSRLSEVMGRLPWFSASA
jgi:dTDP-4-dehydrorhamnose 3,5-epimerase